MANHLYLASLNMVNFKNYQQAEIELSPSMNCFIGNNGAGKTNILDAIYYLSMCKSYLNPIDKQNIFFDASFFVLQSNWEKQNEIQNIYCGVKEGQKKVFKRNKVEYEKLADHIGLFPVVMISPYDRNLILEGSDVRRKWLDGIISQFDRDYLQQLIRYGKILQQRNALLKNQTKNGFFDRESIAIWDEQLVDFGNKIYKERKRAIKEFIPIFQGYYQLLSDDKEKVDIIYNSQLEEVSFSELLQMAFPKDRERQYTTVGLHKDDFVFTINNHPIKKYGSQGQQKSFLIALRLAQYDWLTERLGCKPVMLLDDIFDKLDNHRVERLMQLVNQQKFGQVLLTDTDRDRVDAILLRNRIPYRSFLVRENKIDALQMENVAV